MAQSKHYKEQLAKIDRENLYHPLEAVTLAQETSSKKYDATIDVAMRLSVDPVSYTHLTLPTKA